jgi:hypothetical protein
MFRLCRWFAPTGTRPADVVVFNARIFTSSENPGEAEALAAKEGRIVYVGDHSGVADFAGPNTTMINGRGRFVTPGFVDNHCHPLWIGGIGYLMPNNLYACRNQEDIKAAVRQRAEDHPTLPFIGGIGWRMDQLPAGPRKDILDTVVPDRPVILMSYSGQCGWLNSTAVRLLEQRNRLAFEELGPVRDPQTGECTGECRHFHAVNFLDYFTWNDLGATTEEGIMSAMTKTLEEALACGVTTMNDVQIYPQFVPLLLKFRDRGGLAKVRVRGSYYVGHARLQDETKLKADLAWWKETGARESDPHLILGDSLKFYIDGTADNQTAFLFEPYASNPSALGEPVWTQEEFNRVIEIVDAAGLQACTHACGDAGIHRAINAYEHARAVNGPRDARHRLDHCVLPTPADQNRMAQLGIHAAMQPAHFYGDAMIEQALGPERMNRFMPWRSLEQAGVTISFGSDWCVAPMNPVYGLLISGLRLNYKNDTDWGPGEFISIENGIRHWTRDSARALFMDRDIGSIEVGKYADVVVFNIDLRQIASPEFLLSHEIALGKLEGFVDLTVVGGTTVYRR